MSTLLARLADLKRQRRLASHARYNASEKGRRRNATYEVSSKGKERVEQYRATGKGIIARFRAELNSARACHVAALAKWGIAEDDLQMPLERLLQRFVDEAAPDR